MPIRYLQNFYNHFFCLSFILACELKVKQKGKNPCVHEIYPIYINVNTAKLTLFLSPSLRGTTANWMTWTEHCEFSNLEENFSVVSLGHWTLKQCCRNYNWR